MKTFSFSCRGIPLCADFHPAQGPAKAVLLYYHGGGLLYGQRNDLPDEYIGQITQAGYHLLCMDYLLGPEASLSQIHQSIDAGFAWFLSIREELLGGNCPFVLFGRSAGAYLALTLAHRLIQNGGPAPRALLPFYGYHHFDHPFFQNPSAHYKGFPPVSPGELPSFEASTPLSSASVEERFYIYVYARQSGRWAAMLDSEDTSGRAWGVPEEALARLPPAFLTASTADQDVPFSFSQKMSRLIPNSVFLPVHGLEHDYDRDPSRKESQDLYARCLQWLDAQFS